MKTKVLLKLKPKTQSLGFNEEELQGVAENIAKTIAQDATDEQIDAAIELSIPFLQVSQKMATRVINAAKPPKTADPKEGDQKVIDGSAHTFKDGKWVKDGAEPPKSEDEPAWFKKYRETNDAKIAELTGSKVSEQRELLFKAKLENLSPKRQEAEMKAFKRIQFSDDIDFNAYLTERETDIAAIIQEDADNGLKTMAKPPKGGKDVPETVSAEVTNRIKSREAESVKPQIQGIPTP